MGAELVDSILDDYKTADISEGLRATLAFLEKMTLWPDALGPEDAATLRAAGVSEAAIDDAIQICAAFHMIVRLADSMNFKPPDTQGLKKMTPILLKRGYKL